jgi:hypothetical protein
MQHTTLSRWLARSATAIALMLCIGAAVQPQESAAADAAFDDLQLTANQQYAILCNTCTTASHFSTKAVTTYPRASDSEAIVYNLSTGQVRSIKLDWDREINAQVGGFEQPVEPGLITYVQQVGSMYRQNGNSLAFKLILRADGSVYWKPNSGPVVELRGAGLGKSAVNAAASQRDGAKAGPAMPGTGSPIDARGYNFPGDFRNNYPNYPDTSYDLGFGNTPAGNIDNFVRDIIAGLPNGGVSGIFNGTVTSGAGLTTPVPLINGASNVSKQVSANISVFIPMKDGGYARVEYDAVTGEVKLKEVKDAAGSALPISNAPLNQSLSGRTFNFPGSPRGEQGFFAFSNWAHRNGISLSGVSLTGSGGSVKCSNNGSTQVVCTILPF